MKITKELIEHTLRQLRTAKTAFDDAGRDKKAAVFEAAIAIIERKGEQLDNAWRGRVNMKDRLHAHIHRGEKREHILRLKYKAEVPSLKKELRRLTAENRVVFKTLERTQIERDEARQLYADNASLAEQLAKSKETETQLRQMNRELGLQCDHHAKQSGGYLQRCNTLNNALYESKRRFIELESLLKKLDAPSVLEFVTATHLEALHQRKRWGTTADVGKQPNDWFWLVGYLAGKALAAHISGDKDKALHHTISTAAACCNWHAAVLGKTDMQPGHSGVIELMDAVSKHVPGAVFQRVVRNDEGHTA